MRSLFFALASAVICLLTSCTPAERQRDANVLYDMGVDKFVCALVSNLTQEDDVMRFCAIEEKYRPAIKELLLGKAAGAKASARASEKVRP